MLQEGCNLRLGCLHLGAYMSARCLNPSIVKRDLLKKLSMEYKKQASPQLPYSELHHSLDSTDSVPLTIMGTGIARPTVLPKWRYLASFEMSQHLQNMLLVLTDNSRTMGNSYPHGTAGEKIPGTSHTALMQKNPTSRLYVNRNQMPKYWYCNPQTKFYPSPQTASRVILDWLPREFQSEDSSQHLCILLMVFSHLCSNIGFFFFALFFCFIKWNWKPWKYMKFHA